MDMVRLAAGICYPLFIYAGLRSAGPRVVAVALGIALALHGAVAFGRQRRPLVSAVGLPAACLGGMIALAGFLNEGQFFLLVPTLVNAALLMGFARTLWRGPSMAETFARLRGRELPQDEVVYCRNNTIMWCLFFTFNGSVSLWLALNASLEWWAFYTGGLSYVLLGSLFGVELVYRYWRFRPYDGSITDPLFRKIFPPRESV
jgi:uncharacterized membrane protein